MDHENEVDTFIHIHDAAVKVLADIAPCVLYRVMAAGWGGGDTRRHLGIPVELGEETHRE
jgi:hypothetical protein